MYGMITLMTSVAHLVSSSAALTFLTTVNDKHKSTLPSEIQVKIGERQLVLK